MMSDECVTDFSYQFFLAVTVQVAQNHKRLINPCNTAQLCFLLSCVRNELRFTVIDFCSLLHLLLSLTVETYLVTLPSFPKTIKVFNKTLENHMLFSVFFIKAQKWERWQRTECDLRRNRIFKGFVCKRRVTVSCYAKWEGH